MLMLQRKVGETIVISDNICIKVVDASNGSVRLAIDAPREISILRGELIEAAKINKAANTAGNVNMGSFAKKYGKKRSDK